MSNDPIGPEARSKFARMFASCQPVNGELDGKCRYIDLNS
jgi:hypothetical protein